MKARLSSFFFRTHFVNEKCIFLTVYIHQINYYDRISTTLFCGKAFYELAARHNRSKWGFAILGVGSYYGGLFIGGILIGLVIELGFSMSIDDVNEMALGLMSVPIGVVTCWFFYRQLEKSWSRPKNRFESEEILDAEIPRDESHQ